MLAYVRSSNHIMIIEIYSSYYDPVVFKMSAVLNNMSFAIYGLLYPFLSIAFNGNYLILNTLNMLLLLVAFLMYILNIHKLKEQEEKSG